MSTHDTRGVHMNRRKITNRIPFLTGWKDIARYMGRGVRTVQRYEHDLGLPVRRSMSKSRGSAIATKEEIDAWVDVKLLTHSFALRRASLDIAAVKDFRTALAEQRQLREELAATRKSLHSIVEALHLNVRLQTTAHREFNLKPN